MKKVFLSLCIAGLLAGVSDSYGADWNKLLAVMSYNIRMSAADDGPNSWPLRKEATITMLKAARPDIVGMQEVTAEQFDYVAGNMDDYTTVGVGRDDGKRAGEFMAVMFRKDRFEMLDGGNFWLSETPDEVSRGWDGACNRMVTWVKLRDRNSGKIVFFFNTHFDHMGQVARAESAKLLVRKIGEIAGRETVILTGDFNAKPDDPVLKPLAKRFKSARDKAWATDNFATYNGWGKADDDAIIDHIYYRKAKAQTYKTMKYGYGREYLSDHYPISAIFVIK